MAARSVGRVFDACKGPGSYRTSAGDACRNATLVAIRPPVGVIEQNGFGTLRFHDSHDVLALSDDVVRGLVVAAGVAELSTAWPVRREASRPAGGCRSCAVPIEPGTTFTAVRCR
ncbi:hypothetical protein [Streptomyces tauricus]